ncbi:hypothetical protein LBMAG42_09910 [Deltaproteobacteria bacterium]|nr:hypothetical protein LBMAG42_09910 [Deltaproteobacteria bacterium]
MPPAHEDAAIHAFLRGNPSEQLAWLRARGLPAATLLALHNPCAQRCFFCAGPGTVSVPEAERTSRNAAFAQLQARPPGVTRLMIGGNEPTLHPDFAVLLQAARPAGFTTLELMTNGADLGVHAATWAGLGVTEVIVPLYAASAPLHDGVCGAVCFDRVVSGLDAAFAAGIRVSIHTLLLRRTLGELPALAAFVHQRWGTRLGVALLRDKGSFDFAGEAPAFADARQAVNAVPEPLRPFGIGTPRCLDAAVVEAPLVAELYFRSQVRSYGPGCFGCRLREGCGGVVDAYVGEVHPGDARGPISPVRGG